MSDLPPCKHDIWASGARVFTTHSIGTAQAVDGWVSRIAAESKQPVDWHYSGGTVHILALGDMSLVRRAVRNLMAEHDEMFNRELVRYNLSGALPPPRPDWWEGDSAQGS